MDVRAFADPYHEMMRSAEANVLVIDSNHLSRMVLEDELKSIGCNVTLAASAEQGLELANSLRPDLITVDVALDTGNGVELLNSLKSSESTRNIPFIVITGMQDPIQKELALRAGAAQVMAKPFTHGRVGAFIKAHLKNVARQPGHLILVVEDSGTIRAITRHLLERQGHTVIEAVDGLRGWEELNRRANEIDMVVTDINMPNMDGRRLVEKIRVDERFQFIPVIVSTTISEKESMKLLLSLGADDYIVKPFSTEEFGARIQSHLRVKALYEELRHANQRLAQFNETLEKRVEERTVELRESNMDAIFSLATAAEAKDYDTGYHVHRIQYYSRALAHKAGLPQEECEEIGYSSILHDVGKLAIPDAILKKPAKLTAEEFEIIKTHTLHGERILASKPFFMLARTIARSHHEKWEGTGYPDGIAREDIPMAARIVAIADVYDALINDRPYKKAWPAPQAIDEIRKGAGQHFDPRLVKLWVELYEEGELARIHEQFR